MTLRRLLAAAAVCLLVPVVVVAPGAPASAATTCSTRGLRFTDTEGGVTSSVEVVRLRSTGASCAVARKLATQVADRSLRGRIPRQLDGWTLYVTKPCAGCTPKTHVLGNRYVTAVRFDLLGGA